MKHFLQLSNKTSSNSNSNSVQKISNLIANIAKNCISISILTFQLIIIKLNKLHFLQLTLFLKWSYGKLTCPSVFRKSMCAPCSTRVLIKFSLSGNEQTIVSGVFPSLSWKLGSNPALHISSTFFSCPRAMWFMNFFKFDWNMNVTEGKKGLNAS